MSVPVVINHTGVLTACAWGSSFGSGPIDTSLAASYGAQIQNQQDIRGAISPSPPVTLELGNVAAVRFLQARCIGNSVVLALTSAKGTQQLVPLSGGGELILHLPVVGDELTAVQVYGDGSTVTYFLAGDLD